MGHSEQDKVTKKRTPVPSMQERQKRGNLENLGGSVYGFSVCLFHTKFCHPGLEF
jgi:hypothetical protein